MFFKDQRKSLSHIIDGTSNTVAVSECLTPMEQHGFSSRENMAHYNGMNAAYNGVGLGNSNHGIPGNCTSTIMGFGDTFPTSYKTPNSSVAEYPNTYYGEERGYIFGQGWWISNSFSTMAPPNSPMCVTVDGSWGMFLRQVFIPAV